MKIKKLVMAAVALATLGIVNAEDTMNFNMMTQRAALVRCMTPAWHPEITSELFNAAFPHWMASLQEHVNAGRVNRVHYLGELKEGIFFVVEGKNKFDARKKATVVIDDLSSITEKAIEETGSQPSHDTSEACQFIDIGPVAIQPQ